MQTCLQFFYEFFSSPRVFSCLVVKLRQRREKTFPRCKVLDEKHFRYKIRKIQVLGVIPCCFACILASYCQIASCGSMPIFNSGWMPEWFKGPVLKTGDGVTRPWVRIPLHPLIRFLKTRHIFYNPLKQAVTHCKHWKLQPVFVSWVKYHSPFADADRDTFRGQLNLNYDTRSKRPFLCRVNTAFANFPEAVRVARCRWQRVVFANRLALRPVARQLRYSGRTRC